jgi:YD repeat-containing protein
MRTETSEWDDGSRTIYSYDDAGNRIQTTDRDADGRVTTDIHYQHDQSGNCIGWKVYDRQGVLAHRFEVDHFASGLESENREYDVGGNLVRREVYFYDAQWPND